MALMLQQLERQLFKDADILLGKMDAISSGHFIPTEQLRSDDFQGFFDERKQLLMGLIEKAMGKRSLQ
jgi:hypothetical protein